jgi:mRNA-degrading endonuclease RelE of RelBE toxin-antitoxin system
MDSSKESSTVELLSRCNRQLCPWNETAIFDRFYSEQTLEEIANDPYSFKELKGKFGDLRSARFGKHRIIFTIIERGYLTSSRTEKLGVQTITAPGGRRIVLDLRERQNHLSVPTILASIARPAGGTCLASS